MQHFSVAFAAFFALMFANNVKDGDISSMKIRDERDNNSDLAREIRESSFGWTLNTLAIKLNNYMNSGLKPLGLSLQQFAIMMTLLEKDGLYQSEIGRKIAMPRYATTRNLNKLEELGFIKRNKHELSKRSHCIYLTSKGKSIGPELFAMIKVTNDEFLSPLTNNEKKRARTLLQKLLKQ